MNQPTRCRGVYRGPPPVSDEIKNGLQTAYFVHELDQHHPSFIVWRWLSSGCCTGVNFEWDFVPLEWSRCDVYSIPIYPNKLFYRDAQDTQDATSASAARTSANSNFRSCADLERNS